MYLAYPTTTGLDTSPGQPLVMGKRNIDADECHQPSEFLLVVIDGISVLRDLGYSRDEQNKLRKVLLKFRNINDLKKEIELCLLWEAAPG